MKTLLWAVALLLVVGCGSTGSTGGGTGGSGGAGGAGGGAAGGAGGGTAGGAGGGTAGGAGGGAGGGTAGGTGGGTAGGSGGGTAGGAGGGTAGGAGGGTAGGAGGGAAGGAGGGTAGGAGGGSAGGAGGGTAGGAGGGTAGGAGGGTAGGSGGGAAGGAGGGTAFVDAGSSPCTDAGFAPVQGLAFLSDAGSPYAMTSTNWSIGATAAATTSYPGYPASRAIDQALSTSWFAADLTCTSVAPTFCCYSPLSYEVTFPMDRSVKAVEVRGNREFAASYDVQRGRIELLSVGNTVLAGYDVVFPSPDRDFLLALPSSVVARKVRLVIFDADATGPGIAELAAWGP